MASMIFGSEKRREKSDLPPPNKRLPGLEDWSKPKGNLGYRETPRQAASAWQIGN
jgi:hypothetical protein